MSDFAARIWRNSTFAALTGLLVILAGCAAKQNYQWGGYDELLYRSYKSPEQVEKFRLGLEENIREVEAGHGKVAPGLYAELGALYFQSGKHDLAVGNFQKEAATWPDSRGFMDNLSEHLKKRQAEKGDAK